MDFLLIDATYERDVSLNEEALTYCKQFKTIGLYASVQFTAKLEKVKEQLQDIHIMTSKPTRTHQQHQILGCDVYHKNLNLEELPDAFLYIGDGKFHPRALVFAQKNNETFKEVACYDPISNILTILKKESVEKILKKEKGALLKFLYSNNVGVMVTTKPGQQQFLASKVLEEKYPDKEFYYFVADSIDFTKLEDFPFIECWVNTACPRIGLEDNAETHIPIVNINEVLKMHN